MIFLSDFYLPPIAVFINFSAILFSKTMDEGVHNVSQPNTYTQNVTKSKEKHEKLQNNFHKIHP